MKKKPILPLRIRIFLPVLFFFIPGFVFAIFMLVDQRQREKENILDAATRLASIISIQEEDLIEATKVLLVTTTHDPSKQKCSPNDIQNT